MKANVGKLKTPQKQLPSHDYVLTNKGEIDALSKYILDYPNIETGGQLFGYWTYDGKPVVLFVLGPGPNAKHQNTFFMQDLSYLRERAKVLKKKIWIRPCRRMAFPSSVRIRLSKWT